MIRPGFSRESGENSASCPHGQAHWLPVSDVGLWEYTCESCGLVGYGDTLADAKRVFGQHAERARVEGLLERREAGEKLAPHEEMVIAYSPYGTGQHCAGFLTGFFLSSC